MTECPNPEFHGNPFRYCGCGWREEPDAAPSLLDRLAAVEAENERLNRRLFPGQGESYANEVERQRAVIDTFQSAVESLRAGRDQALQALQEIQERINSAARRAQNWRSQSPSGKRARAAADDILDAIHPFLAGPVGVPAERVLSNEDFDALIATERDLGYDVTVIEPPHEHRTTVSGHAGNWVGSCMCGWSTDPYELWDEIAEANREHSGVPAEQPERTTLRLGDERDSIKMLRETFCVAQGAVMRAGRGEWQHHASRLERLIHECDRQRPLASDGKHGNLHTPTCGCVDVAPVAEPLVADPPQACSTCHQPMDSPPCSLNPETRRSFHTVAGLGGRAAADPQED